MVSELSTLLLTQKVECRNTFWHLAEPFRTHSTLLSAGANAHGLGQDGPPVIGNPIFIGPVWEPAFAKALWNAGLKIVMQYPENGYLLDIALVSEDRACRLNVEVDGRSTHCDRRGRRKIKDVLRDAVLQQSGWIVKRFWVRELMDDMDACVSQVGQLWQELLEKERV